MIRISKDFLLGFLYGGFTGIGLFAWWLANYMVAYSIKKKKVHF